MAYVPEGIQTIEENYHDKFEFPSSYLCKEVFSAFILKYKSVVRNASVNEMNELLLPVKLSIYR